jgi:hypothetical protein
LLTPSECSWGSVDVLGLLWSGRRQEEDLVDELVDLLMELSRVDPVMESSKLLLPLLRDGIGSTQAIGGGFGLGRSVV